MSPWELAGSMCFQHVINDVGTEEEKERLENMQVGYRRGWRKNDATKK
jgi:hypothetical protein